MFTRLDISYAVQQLCLFMHTPRNAHYAFMKRVLCYIQGALHLGLHMYASSSTSTMTAYSDADWGGCPESRQSTFSYCIFLGDKLISSSSKRQSAMSQSSAEAEYRGVANAVAEVTWLRNLLLELHVHIKQAKVVIVITFLLCTSLVI